MPHVAEDILRELYQRHGELTPQMVVEEAKPLDHPMHSQFEWDDSIAGPSYRREQARLIIKAVRFRPVGNPEEETIRTYHAVRIGVSPDFSYLTSQDIAEDDHLAGKVLMHMEQDWQRLFKRWCSFKEFRSMVRRDLERIAS